MTDPDTPSPSQPGDVRGPTADPAATLAKAEASGAVAADRVPARPLPEYLARRYAGWRATSYQENRAWYRRLVEDGQRPRAMIVACCDSRVHVGEMFGADSGEFFIHRNIANLIPPYAPDGGNHGTSAAVEYAVTALRVTHLIVMGHTHCGGVKGCYEMCEGRAPELDEDTSFVGRWMDILRPAHVHLPPGSDDERVAALEFAAVTNSLRNLMTFPFVRDAVARGDLALHGVVNDLAEGILLIWDSERDTFSPMT